MTSVDSLVQRSGPARERLQSSRSRTGVTWEARRKQSRWAGFRQAAILAAAVTIAPIVATAGCSGYVKRGCSLYADGRYVEAAEVFERTEHRLRQSTPRQQAEYGLYRGLTLLVLGDTRNAHRWMAYAYQVERFNPGALRPNRRALLDRGWFELGRRVNSPVPQPTQPVQPAAALAASQPAQPAAVPQPPPQPTADGQRRSLMP